MLFLGHPSFIEQESGLITRDVKNATEDKKGYKVGGMP